MTNLKITLLALSLIKLFFIILIFNQVQSPCSYPYQRCICTTSTPYCPCTYLTSTQTLNLTSSYYSHLVPVNGYGCRPCPPKCKKCTFLEICTDCFDEFQLMGNFCQPCPINCKTCKLGVCQQCVDEYYIDYQQKCQKCPLQGTKTCTIDSLRSCQSNYWLDNNGAQCVNCDVNCKNCSSTTKCTKCLDGFYQNNFQCSACKSQCKTCQHNSSCIECLESGYYFNSTLSLCIPCSSVNCLSCANNGTCLLCSADTSYYLDKITKLCQQIDPTKNIVYRNCKNLTYSTDYNCQLCKDGYYLLTDYTNSSQLICYYGCSILCNKCTGPHYGLCDSCVSDTDFNLINRNCIPKNNLNSGTAFQYFYTAFNNNSFFDTPKLIQPDSCWHQYAKGGSSQITIKLSKLGVYKMTLKWKIYKYNFSLSTYSTNQMYNIQINNSLILKQNQTLGYSLISSVCQDRSGFSSLCSSGTLKQCVDKNQMTFENIITSDENQIKFTSSNSYIAISQVLLIGYRCGGIYGDGCIQCTDINTCTKCDNPDYYLIAEKCISQCPKTHYTYQQLKKCIQLCPSGSYSDDSLHQCLTCQSPCETCTSNSDCITCKDGFFYSKISNKCQAQCPNLYYKDYYRKICQKCTNPCLQCIDSVMCISCKEGFLDLNNQTVIINNVTISVGDCVLQCSDGYYTDLSTMKCQECKLPCKTCTSLNDICTSCSTGYFLFQSDCLITCPEGYYQDINSSSCHQCDASCKNCLNLTYCLECQLGFYLQTNNQCISHCSLGFYNQQILKQCNKCNVNCSTCRSDTICSSCITNFNYFEQNYQCLQQCPKFYYSVKSSNQSLSCNRCQLPCYDCLSQTYCLSCYDAFLYNGSCLLVCPTGYYANVTSLKCEKCDLFQCMQCKNSATQCTKCYASLLLVNQKCLSSCPNGFYFSDYKQQCILCEGLCSSCLNATYCLSCIVGFLLQKDSGTCVNSCQAGYYQVVNQTSGQFTCAICSQNCQVCIFDNSLNVSKCLTCLQDYFLTQEGTCQSVCPDGYFSFSGTCQSCSLPCLACNDSQYCLTCQIGYGIVYEGACIIQCPYGYFQKAGQCQICDSSCLLCSGQATMCKACQANSFLLVVYLNNNITQIKSTCVTICPPGYCQINSNQSSVSYESKCQKCSQNCLTCGSQFNLCTSCSGTKLLYEARCVNNCPIQFYANYTTKQCVSCGPLCQYCLNSSFCLQCNDNYFINSDSICQTSCNDRYYGMNGVCRECIYPCGNCTDQDACLSCQIGVLFDGQCVEQCPEGSYYLLKDNLSYCLLCAVNCSRCVSQNECLFCEIGYLFNSTCLQTCPSGFYPNYGVCLQCQQNCLTCSNSYSCLTCQNNTYFYENRCIQFCPAGYYQTFIMDNSGKLQAKCMPCITACSKCFNTSSQCMQCNKGYFLHVDQCLEKCPSGTYAEDKFLICELCVSPCQTCQNSYSCQTCIYSYLLYRQFSRNQCVEGPNCPNNYYLNVDESICQFICPTQSYISNSTKTCSKQCPAGLVMYQQNKSCLQVCPDEMWIDNSLYCQPNETRPDNLPYLKCQKLQVRNLFFFKCSSNVPIINIDQLQISDFLVSSGIVTMINIKSNLLFYVMVQNIDRQLKSQYLTLTLVNKYKLFGNAQINGNIVSNTFIQSDLNQVDLTNNSSRLLFNKVSVSYQTYPVQNYKVFVFVQDYMPYTIQQRQIGINFSQIGQSISYGALVLWFFSLLKNLKATSLLFIINLQWLYELSFLSQNDSYAPNFNQFLQSLKISALIDINGSNEGNSVQSFIWQLKQMYSDKFWAIHNFYDFSNSLLPIYALMGIFVIIYLISLMLQKVFYYFGMKKRQQQQRQQQKQRQAEIQKQKQNVNRSEGNQKKSEQQQLQNRNQKQIACIQQKCHKQEQIKVSFQQIQHSIKQAKQVKQIKQQQQKQRQSSKQKQKQALQQRPKRLSQILLQLSKKSEIIKQRFSYNYLYQILLITSTSICLSMNIQLTKPTITNFIQLVILLLIYIIFYIISFYYYYKSQTSSQYKHLKPLRSTAFFFIHFIQIMIQNVIIIWASLYLFVGFAFVMIIIKIVSWNWIYKLSQPSKCSYLQLIQLSKGFVLLMIIIGDMKRSKWSIDQMIYFGYGQIATSFILILLTSISIAQQLFKTPQSSSNKKSNKNIHSKNNILVNNKKYKQQNKDGQNKSVEQTSGFEDEDEDNDEQSFFSNRSPLDSDEQQSSDGDLIDFDQFMNQQSGDSHRHNQINNKNSNKQTNNNSNKQQTNNNRKKPPINLYKYNKNT